MKDPIQEEFPVHEESLEKITSIQRFKSIEEEEQDTRQGYFEMQKMSNDQEMISYQEDSDDYSIDELELENAKSKTAHDLE
jgi:hypothetical protein